MDVTVKPGKPSVGDIVEVSAVDWGIYAEQLDVTYEFNVVRGRIYGQVVRVTDDSIAVAPQVFSDGGCRYALAIPWGTVTQIVVYGKVEK